jgi:hypothetical protein
MFVGDWISFRVFIASMFVIIHIFEDYYKCVCNKQVIKNNYPKVVISGERSFESTYEGFVWDVQLQTKLSYDARRLQRPRDGVGGNCGTKGCAIQTCDKLCCHYRADTCFSGSWNAWVCAVGEKPVIKKTPETTEIVNKQVK